MATPNSLPGSDPSVTVDGVDLHTFGMVVNQVLNPVPSAKPSAMAIPGKHGDFDFANRYGVRHMTLRGYILGDTNAALLTNIDAAKEYFRLRQNRGTIEVIFQNQTGRYWTCRYEGSFDIQAMTKWRLGRAASYTLALKCTKPYSEKTTATTETVQLSTIRNHTITYDGTFPTPLQLLLRADKKENILEKVGGDTSEDYTTWTYDNATGSDLASGQRYGTNRIKVDQTAGGAYYCEVDVTAQITLTNNYVFGGWISSTANTDLVVVLTDGVDKEVTIGAGELYTFIKVTAAELSGVSAVLLRIYNDGTDAALTFDGMFIYEISAAQAADDDYWPAPYYSDPAGDDYVPPKNPKLWLHNSVNIYPDKNGVAVDSTRWGEHYAHVIVSNDPLGGSEKCWLWAPDANIFAYGPIFYVQGGKAMRGQLDYLVDYLAVGVTVEASLALYSENGTALGSYLVSMSESSVGTAWATEQYSATTNNEAVYARLLLNADGAARVYIKNIIAEESAAYSEYVPPDRKELEYTGTLDVDDALQLDMDRGVAQILDASAGTVSNAMGSLTYERLMLVPNTNILRYVDARLGAANPETESCGFVRATISYRERYL